MPRKGSHQGIPHLYTSLREREDGPANSDYRREFVWTRAALFQPIRRPHFAQLVAQREGDAAHLQSRIPLGSGAIWRTTVEPNAMAKAKMILREETLYRTQPQWSPDGKRMLYSSHRGSQFNNLYVLPVDGGEPYQMTFGDWDHFDPRWSPDGERIAYISNRHGLSELRILRAFGGEDEKVDIEREYGGGRWQAGGAVARSGAILSDGIRRKTYTPPTAYQRVAAGPRGAISSTPRTSCCRPSTGVASLEMAKAIEYYPISKKITIQQDQVTRVDLDLQRMTSMNAAGWWKRIRSRPHELCRQSAQHAGKPDDDGAGRGSRRRGEKICNKDQRIFDYQFFTANRTSSPAANRFSRLARVPSALLRHINFINLTRHLISPFTTGYEGRQLKACIQATRTCFWPGENRGAWRYVHPWSGDPTRFGYAWRADFQSISL